MNIWIINHYAVPPSRAGGTRHWMLARELTRLGHTVVVVAADYSHAERRRYDSRNADEVCAGVRFRWVRTPAYTGNGLRRVWNMLVFAAAILSGKQTSGLPRPSVIIGSSPHPFAAAAALLVSRRLFVPFVLEVRDVWPQSLVEIGGLSRVNPLVLILGWLEKWLYRSADQIVTLLPTAAPHIASNGGKLEKIHWIPNGVDVELFGKDVLAMPGEPKAEVAEQSTVTVMYVGSHGEANALDVILRAAEILQPRLPSTRFRFIGDGPQRELLAGEAAQRKLRNVVFEGAIPRSEVAAALREADILVASMRASELYQHGISLNKIYDYLAAGKPVVFAAAVPDNPISQAGAGIVVPPSAAHELADAIAELEALGPAGRAAVGEKGRQFVMSRHSSTNLASTLERVLLTSVNSERRS